MTLATHFSKTIDCDVAAIAISELVHVALDHLSITFNCEMHMTRTNLADNLVNIPKELTVVHKGEEISVGQHRSCFVQCSRRAS
jgi:hypothetical protein